MAKKGNKTGQWAQKHINDPFVKKANGEGYRSRAVYKLQEIDQQDKLIKPNSTVVDLGSAPGGWSQYVAKKLDDRGCLVAIDLLAMEPVHGATFIQDDFQSDEAFEQIVQALDGRQLDLVISDMAPNITGIRDVDEAQYEGLLESVLWFCDQYLKPGGSLLVKLFEGSAAHFYRREVKTRFKRGVVRKPAASRSQSREFYFLSTGKL
jgi:23S rRNA (uridine2552-2'-O)-methyltransferase